MSDIEAVRLQEDERTGDRFLVYGTDKGLALEMRYEGDSLWMTQAQIAELFGVTRPSVSIHLTNIYEEGELEREATCKEILQVRQEGTREVSRMVLIHNLDAVISVGYRVSSKQATLFRRWATETLVRFATKGFVIDQVRLKQPDAADRIAELREIIRDIRSDEANVYRELRQICSMCQDYDPASKTWREFYSRTQAKLVFAVVSQTPSEVVKSRADADLPDMGLTNWSGDHIRKQDVGTSKNYLAEGEANELNRLTTILLDIFEDQLKIGRLTTMADAAALLDRQLDFLGRAVLSRGGSVSSDEAKRHAEEQYERYKTQQKLLRHQEADRTIAALKAAEKDLPKPRRR